MPATGRFSTEDPHWNVANMMYGEDGLPSMANIMQSGNLYLYCGNNAVNRWDSSGKVVTDWDRNVLPEGFVSKLQYYTDNWSTATEAQKLEWRADAERMRAKWRNKYEYTDENGITRSKETGNEIIFVSSETSLGTATLRIKAGYSYDAQGNVVLATHRQAAYLIDGGYSVDYSTIEQNFSTDGSKIYYSIVYTMTVTSEHWWIPAVSSGKGKISGEFVNLK